MHTIYTNLSNLLFSAIEAEEELQMDSTILEFNKIPPLEDPVFWLSVGFFICLMSGLIFADIMRTKLNNWTAKKISPLPLQNPRTISSWFSFFSGLTIVFCSALNIVNFSISKSIFFSIIVSILFGIAMWKAINDLLNQLYNGTIKEIDEFF